MCFAPKIPDPQPVPQQQAAKTPDGDASVASDDRNRLRLIRAAAALPGNSAIGTPSTTSGGMIGAKSTLGG